MNIDLLRYLLLVYILSFFLWNFILLLHIVMNSGNSYVVVYCYLVFVKVFFRLLLACLRLYKRLCILHIFSLGVLSVVHFYLCFLICSLLFCLFLLGWLLRDILWVLLKWDVIRLNLNFGLMGNIHVWIFAWVYMLYCTIFRLINRHTLFVIYIHLFLLIICIKKSRWLILIVLIKTIFL